MHFDACKGCSNILIDYRGIAKDYMDFLNIETL